MTELEQVVGLLTEIRDLLVQQQPTPPATDGPQAVTGD